MIFSKNIKLKMRPLDYDELLQFKNPFIAHLTIFNGIFVVVLQVNDHEVNYFLEGKNYVTLSKEEFLKVWNNIVLIAYPSAQSCEPEYRQHHQEYLFKKVKLPLLLSVLGLILIIQFVSNFSAMQLLPLLATKAIGLFFVSLLIKHELGIHSEMVDKLCTMSKSAGCNEVLKSKGAKLFGKVLLADLGLVWFVSSFIFIFIHLFTSKTDYENIFNLLGWLSIASVPFILFSVSYQAFIIRKYCPLCLGVMSTLIVDVLLLIAMYGFRFAIPSYSCILLMISILSVVLYVWLLIKNYYTRANTLDDIENKYLHLKRNPSVLQLELQHSENIEGSNFPNPLRLTENNSEILLTEVINLYCSPCKQVIEKIDKLLQNCNGNCPDLQIVLLANAKDKADVMTITAAHLLSIADYLTPNQRFIALREWLESMDYNKWSQKYPVEISDRQFAMLKENVAWFKEHKVHGTPTAFLNTKKIPDNFDITDIQYMIN
ncbi:MAG TPA: vitamin K epoxide reductase family protein [Bacteroidales bacterium]|nr:vitamin K epoxide reductase family protein [Bacteroidales bacterium]